MKKFNVVMPPAWIAIIGGGQLGKMLTLTAQNRGYKVLVLDPNPQAPAGAVAHKHLSYAYDDPEGHALLGALASVITYEFEHLPMPILEALTTTGVPIIPSLETLALIQDKYLQRSHLRAHKLPLAEDRPIDRAQDLYDFLEDKPGGCILKPRKGGYDGKGTYFIYGAKDVLKGLDHFQGHNLYAEALVDFHMEVSVMVAKSQDQTLTYPVAENHHDQGILRTSYVPARLSDTLMKKASQLAQKAVDTFDSIGLFCVEMFVESSGDILINEIAPRAHNSGHYTLEACPSSQFDQWLRIITGMALARVSLYKPSVMVNILGPQDQGGLIGLDGLDKISPMEDVFFHWYNKTHSESRRKLGHITAINQDLTQAETLAQGALKALKITLK